MGKLKIGLFLAVLILLIGCSQSSNESSNIQGMAAGGDSFSDPINSFQVVVEKTNKSSHKVHVKIQDYTIYKHGYYSKNGSWKNFTLDSSQPSIKDWYFGNASKTLELEKTNSTERHVILYSCSQKGNSSCHEDRWQLKSFVLSDKCVGGRCSYRGFCYPHGHQHPKTNKICFDRFWRDI